MVVSGLTHRTRKSDQLEKDRVLLRNIGLDFGEAAMLCDALRALWLSPQFMRRIWREMYRVIRADGLEQKWSTSADKLMSRLVQLRRSEATAILRAAIRFWERHEEPTARLLSELMLLRPAEQPGTRGPSPQAKSGKPVSKPRAKKRSPSRSKPQ